MDLRSLTLYANVSVRTLGDWVRDPVDPLPASRKGKKIYVRRQDFDDYLERHRMPSDSLVDEIMDGLDISKD